MDDSYPSDLPGVDLSTVRLDLSLIGRRAVETVRALLTGENHVSLTVDLGYELTLRGTTRTYRT
jgi:DNA-binding LacI/PurR family transcriptional regulator